MAWAIDSRIARHLRPVVWIMVVNVAVFLLLQLVTAIFGDGALRWIEMPSQPSLLLSRPWTALTYMVSQYDFFHLLVNMVWLWCFGQFLQDILPVRRLVTLYVAGGLAGAAVFIAATAFMPSPEGATRWLIGSSASVIAIVAATAILMPALEVNLFMIGPLQLRWVAWITIALDLTGLWGINPGSHFAHLGGLIAGVAYALWFRRAPSRPRPRRDTYTSVAEDRRRLDELLDKVRQSGFASLTIDERRTLMQLSERERNR